MLGIRVVSLSGKELEASLSATFDDAGGDIGRSAECTLTLPDPQRQISRRQALIGCRAGRYYIRTIGTNLEVELDGQALTLDVDQPLESGAEIRIGPYLLRAEAEAARQVREEPVLRASSVREVDLLVGDSTEPAELPALAATGGAPELFAVLYEGLGLPTPQPAGQTPQQLRLIGALLRKAIEGTLELLAERAIAKRELGAGATVPHARENNPLKFSPDADTALEHLLGPSQRGFIGPLAAVAEALGDLRAHEVAVLASMRAGLNEVMARFDPTTLQTQLAPKGPWETLLPGSREARLWAHYAKRHQYIVQEIETDLDALLARAFRQAYETQLAEMASARSATKDD